MQNKAVFVTGGSQGIGKAIAIEFAKAQASVYICARTKKDVESAIEDIRSAGASCCVGFVADVRDSARLKDIEGEIYQHAGSLDVLIACAGIYGPLCSFDNAAPEAWKEALDVNLLGTVYAAHAAVPLMKQQGHGTIITLAGGGVGGTVKPNMSSYVTSKFGVCGFTEALATELKQYNIQVNAIAPGAVNTRLLDQVLAAGVAAGEDFLAGSRMQKKTGGIPPEKAAQLALYLASEAGRSITGKVLSAVWDDTSTFGQKKERLAGSLYTLRRIDDDFFTGRK
jgi:3-oxoacyl-[acyl-carrier protein] reductase